MYFLIFESIFNSRIQHKNIKSKDIYEHYFNYIFWSPLLAVLINQNKKKIKCCGNLIYEEKICQNLYQRRKVKLCMCSDTLNGKNFQKICVTLQWHRSFHYVNGQL